MPDDVPHPDGRLKHPEIRYETKDANFRWILGLIVAALVLAALIHLTILGFFYRYREHLDTKRQSPFPLAATPSGELPPEPRLEQVDRLEGITRADFYVREKSKLSVLDSYGRTEVEGFVHIPVDQAMRILAGKLPVRQAEKAGERHDLGLVDFGEPNSGRVFRRNPRWFER